MVALQPRSQNLVPARMPRHLRARMQPGMTSPLKARAPARSRFRPADALQPQWAAPRSRAGLCPAVALRGPPGIV